ncbi:tripartite tricarboxylate transporter substrate binding protein [Bradyrhizobium sp. LTSP885]|uniref:Bug family tripartite tricarboxylate transporter substrate binding protein n=1 Tax=Bradyrhizobium sp. LTSP885 TaxID=1619232 RepID=UPI0005CAA3CB|nr:tripartite tricarboxylate transporter substrate binding protein [Bradyrhizobium sp. LTSP885]
MNGTISLRLAFIFLVLAQASGFAPANAAPYQAGPVRLVVGFGPASPADIVARLVARHLEEALGKPVIVENRPGNSSMLAAEAVARAPNDGRTLFVATVANTINPARMKSGFDLGKELAPIALLGVVPNVLVANPSLPVKTVGDLIALAKQQTGQLTFGTSGLWTASHMAVAMFNMKAGTDIVAVPYQGGASQAVTDLLAGRINLMFNVAAPLAPFVASGQLTALAVGQPKRTAILPDVPTMEEAGLTGFDVGVWIGLLAPAGTAPEIIDTLAKASNEALQQPSIREALKAQGIEVLGGTPAEFASFIARDIEKWRSLIEAAGLKE